MSAGLRPGALGRVPTFDFDKVVARWGMNIIVYYKTGCPWAVEVMDFLDDHHLSFEERNISVDDEARQECIEKSGQAKSPTLDINGEILADTDVDTVAEYLESHGVNV